MALQFFKARIGKLKQFNFCAIGLVVKKYYKICNGHWSVAEPGKIVGTVASLSSGDEE